MWSINPFTKRADTTVPVPFVVAPSGQFEGSDGSWSTFKIGIGTPAQDFHVTVSNLAAGIWVPYGPGACQSSSAVTVPESQCAAARGIQTFNSGISLGYEYNASSSSNDVGPYGLFLNSDLHNGNMGDVYGPNLYSIGAEYGTDTVTLSAQSSSAQLIQQSTIVAGIEQFVFTLGSLGLGFGDLSIGGISGPTFLESLANSSKIPSRSWAYTAGAVYQPSGTGTVGSLILGGYDQFRVGGANATFSMPATTDESLLKVSVSSFTLTYGNGSVQSVTASSSLQVSRWTTILDSTLPYLYLPDDICDSLVSLLGLDYDAGNDIYFWNSSSPAPTNIDSFSLNLVDTQGGSNSTTIKLPFAAFNLTSSWPILTAENETENIFPIRKLSNVSDTYILGRAFFQEAYVVADYERRSFTVAQAAFPTTASTNIVPIYNTSFAATSPSPSSTGGGKGGGGDSLSGGAIAGIVIGVLAGLAIFLGIAFFLWRKRKRDAKQNSQVHAAAFDAAQEEKLGQQANFSRERSDTVLSGETATSYEMSAFPLGHRPSHQRHVSELSSDSERTEAAKLRTPSAIYEMPDTSHWSANERARAVSPSSDAPTRETSTRTAQSVPSPLMSATSPHMSREPLSGVSEAPEGSALLGAPSPPTSPTPTRQLSGTPTRGQSRFSERSSDMLP